MEEIIIIKNDKLGPYPLVLKKQNGRHTHTRNVQETEENYTCREIHTRARCCKWAAGGDKAVLPTRSISQQVPSDEWAARHSLRLLLFLCLYTHSNASHVLHIYHSRNHNNVQTIVHYIVYYYYYNSCVVVLLINTQL
jgi:hypothetical protein